MEFYIIMILAITTSVLFIKWRQSESVQKKGWNQASPTSESDLVLKALFRIETKVDSLTLAIGEKAIPDSSFEKLNQVADSISIPSTVPAQAFVPLRPEPRLAVAPRTQDVPRSTPAWERDARAILAKIWSWLLVGEEFRPKGVSLEFAMASTWLMRVGIVVLVCCVGWFGSPLLCHLCGWPAL